MGGGSAPKPAAAPVRVSQRPDQTKKTGRKVEDRRSLGSQFLQTRKRLPTGGGGFGGQNLTLG